MKFLQGLMLRLFPSYYDSVLRSSTKKVNRPNSESRIHNPVIIGHFFFLVLCFTLFSCVPSRISNTVPNADKISTIEFVQVQNGNKSEARYYFENNWKALRVNAMKKNYIHRFQLLETEHSEEAPFDFMLMTTYTNKEQFDQREANFGELIEASGGLKLLNDKQPKEFRKSYFSKDVVRHL